MRVPPTRRGDCAELLHGVRVEDPYRWLEDGASAETKQWVADQNAVTFDYLASLPWRERMRSRLTALWSYERFSRPFRAGRRWFWLYNEGLQNQDVLFTAHRPDAAGRLLLDPNALSTDGTVALSGLSASPDGRLLAYAVSVAGSDWQEWRVRCADTGEDLPDLLRWAKFTDAAWTRDGKGFFYARFDEPAEGQEFQQQSLNHKVYYHRLGDEQAQDRLIYSRPDQPEWYMGARVTEDGRYLLIDVSRGTDPENRVFVADLGTPTQPEIGAEVRPLLAEGDAQYGFVTNSGSRLIFTTDLKAPLGRIVAIDAGSNGAADLSEVVSERGDSLEWAASAGGRIYAGYLHDAHTAVWVYTLTGRARGEVRLPGIGSAGGFGGHAGDRTAYYSYSSFAQPAAIYALDIATGSSRLFRRPQLDLDPDQYETSLEFAVSKDGARIPVFLCMRKGSVRDGRRPVYLTGYGGFRISLQPGFHPNRPVWMDEGGIFALAILRGGGEYGKEWHDAGRLANKQNVFDDFQAIARHLVDAGWTQPGRIAIAGGSNGGLLVGACLTQAPELFGCALPAVGVMDMLRFHKFTVGWGWTSDYGNPDDAEDFATLLRYSPLHNVKPGARYPATLVTTSDHDDRVVPAHSFKFAAALQAAQGGPAPTLIRIEVDAGHGAGKPIAKTIQEAADVLAFAAAALGMEPPEASS